jgi:hypothetical protein
MPVQNLQLISISSMEEAMRDITPNARFFFKTYKIFMVRKFK